MIKVRGMEKIGNMDMLYHKSLNKLKIQNHIDDKNRYPAHQYS